jgi:hypothetical protein
LSGKDRRFKCNASYEFVKRFGVKEEWHIREKGADAAICGLLLGLVSDEKIETAAEPEVCRTCFGMAREKRYIFPL